MISLQEAKDLLVQRHDFDASLFQENAFVRMPEGTFTVSLLYSPLKRHEGQSPYPNQREALLDATKETVCYIESGKLMHPARRLAHMMCSGIFIWFADESEFSVANDWFRVAFKSSLREFAFAEEMVGNVTIYFFKGCPDITMRAL